MAFWGTRLGYIGGYCVCRRVRDKGLALIEAGHPGLATKMGLKFSKQDGGVVNLQGVSV